MPSRRAFLVALSTSVVVGSPALAGCVEGGTTGKGVPSDTSEPSEEVEPSRTTIATSSPDGTTTPYYDGECEAVAHNWADPKRDSVEPKSLPEGPPNFDGAVGTWVANYERVYLYNRNLSKDTKRASVDVGYVEVERLGSAYLVTLESEYNYEDQSVLTADETATAVVGHSGMVTRTYLVTRRRLVRADSEFSTPSAVADAGETVECWSEE